MKKSTLIIISFLIFSSIAYAEKNQERKPLPNQLDNLRPIKIGNKVPNIRFQNVINYGNKTAMLSDFKGKLLILDFWTTGCTPCIKAFPNMEALQKEFGNRIQILLINTSEDSSKIWPFLKKREKIINKKVDLPIAWGNKGLDRLFPHIGVPHEVWINGKGILVAITDAEVVNTKNITAVLDNKSLSIEDQRAPDYRSFDLKKSLFEQVNFKKENPLPFYSMITQGQWEMEGSDGYQLNYQNRSRITFINNSVKMLYQKAYFNDKTGFLYPVQRIVIETKQPEKYEVMINGIWQFDNMFCYDLIVPSRNKTYTLGDLYSFMKQDLDRYFGFLVTHEKRMMKSLVLTASDSTRLLSKTKAKKTIRDQYSVSITNRTISEFTDALEYYRGDGPILNETGIVGNIDLKIEADLADKDLINLNKELDKYKMRLTWENRLLDVLVLKEPL